ncbi:MAG: SDR family oxidoreductase [Coxiellaceae bacterium]|nr:SDR family oxidoreductase [Coxiellaceae bacterium]
METILITGAAGKLGKTITDHLTNRGINVLATGRNKDKLTTLKQSCEKLEKAQVFTFCKNHYDNDFSEELTLFIKAHKIRVTGCINNIRDLSNITSKTSGEKDSWQNEFYLGVMLPYELSVLLSDLGHLKSIINISSIYGTSVPNLNLYSDPTNAAPIQYGVVKAAQNKLTKELAVRLAAKNICVNSVAYGGVEGRASGTFKSRYSNLCPAGRMLNPQDIPSIIYHLLFESSPMLTGQVISIDGGWGLW